MSQYTSKDSDSLLPYEYEFCPDGRWRITRNIFAGSPDLFGDRTARRLRGQEWFGRDGKWSHDPGVGFETHQEAYHFWLRITRNDDARYTVQKFWYREPASEPITNLTWEQKTAKVGGQIAIGWDVEQNLEVGESTYRLNGPEVFKITRTA